MSRRYDVDNAGDLVTEMKRPGQRSSRRPANSLAARIPLHRAGSSSAGSAASQRRPVSHRAAAIASSSMTPYMWSVNGPTW